MKTKSYTLTIFLVLASMMLFAQSGIIIQSGGKVTINGNTIIYGQLSLSLAKTDVTCDGFNDGKVTAVFAGGTAPFLLRIGSGSYFSASSPFTFSGLTPGTYTICVKDDDGTEVCQSITIDQGVDLTLSLSMTGVSCSVATDGTITATFSGGSGNFQAKIDDGGYFSAASPKTFTGLSLGTHTVYIKEVNSGCEKSASIDITVNASAQLNLSLSMTGVSAPGATDGTVTATFSGGSGIFKAKIDDGTYSEAMSPKTFYGLSAGLHTVYIMDNASGCETSASIEVEGNSWTCGQSITDSRDGKAYSTVQIGTQCWMAQNLNIGTRIAGSSDQTNNGIIEKYCYDDDETNCNTYGGLYQWDETMQYSTTPGVQGICPSGWHLPSDAEWTTLTTFLGGESVAGGKIKEAGTSHWLSPNTGATNSSGFTALPGGYRYGSGDFYDLTLGADFWSSTEYSSTSAWFRGLSYNLEGVSRTNIPKADGFSARCVQD